MKLYHTLCLLLLLVPGISLSGYAADYQLGEGYNIGMLNVSGYSNLVLDVPNQGSTQLMLDDLSIFLSARLNRYLNPFIEFELTNAPLFIEGTGFFHGGSPRLVIERAYNDIQLSDELSFRFGKMLSPVGEWNTIHAAPLVWTTIRPLTTYYNFSEFVSGVSLIYNDSEGVFPDVQVYYQPADEFFREPRSVKPFRYQDVGGINIAFTNDLQKRLGFSVQHAENINYGEHQVLLGLDGRYSFGPLRLETEMTYTWITQKNNFHPSQKNEWGAYLQGIYSITDEWHLIARGEMFQSRYQSKTSDHVLFGVVYRPVPAVSFKAEYVETFGPHLDFSRGFYASMAVLF
jgi:hypothetical protein